MSILKLGLISIGPLKPSWIQLNKIKTVLSYQFPGLDIDQILGEVDVKVSRKTQRIREVRDISSGNELLLFSLRTHDGRLIPSFEAGKRIIKSGYSNSTVVISEEAAEFVAQGKSAFCKHVLQADENIYPLSEVFILNPKGDLLAVATAVQPGYAMLELNSGIAAKPRSYLSKN